jgi:hypothetical protein
VQSAGSYFEVIGDTVDPKRQELVHPVGHFRLDVDEFFQPLFTSYDGWIDTQPWNRIRTWQPASNPLEFYQLYSPVVPSSLLSTFADEAFEALVPQVPQEVSLPNFIWEAREIGSLLPKLGKSMGSTVNGAFLNYQFGWKPFIGDLQKLAGIVDSVRARLAYLRATRGRETRLSYMRTFDHSHAGISVQPDRNIAGSYLSSWKGVFRCGGYLYHLLERLDGIEGELRAASAALGLLNPAAVIWESIPYSFVADWLGRIGNAIGRLGIQPFSGEWSMKRFTYSLSVQSVWVHNGVNPNLSVYPHVPAVWPGHIVRCSRYERRLGLPVPATWLTSQGLTPQQQMLAFALLTKH